MNRLAEVRRDLWKLHIHDLWELALHYWGGVPELMTKRDLVYELAYDVVDQSDIAATHDLACSAAKGLDL